MSLPPDGTTPQIVPESASEESDAMEPKAGEEFEVEKALQFCRLNDRRVMETKQELDRIEQMGKVSSFCFAYSPCLSSKWAALS